MSADLAAGIAIGLLLGAAVGLFFCTLVERIT